MPTLALIALLAAGPARGASDGRTSGFERSLNEIAGALADGGATIDCASPSAWQRLAIRNGFDPETTWGTTPLEEVSGVVRAVGPSNLAPRTCAAAVAFAAKPTEMGSRICPHGTTPRWTAANTARKGVPVALFGECDGWATRLVAVHVITHETMHLANVIDEASADCLAMQVDAFVATKLGASPTFGRSLADEYWRLYYPEQPASYRSAECRPGGALDLFPQREGWPTPSRYPASLRPALAAFVASATSRGNSEPESS